MKIYISQELENGYDHWKKIFDSLESQRQEAGIRTIVVACEAENSNKMHCIMEIPSMEVIKEFMLRPGESRSHEKCRSKNGRACHDPAS